MLHFRLLAATGLVFAGLSALAQPRTNVFVLPQAGQGGEISVYNSNPFSLVATASTVADPAHLFLNPAGTRAYVIGASGVVSVLDATANFNQIEIYSLGGQQVRGAAITPDGRKLLVLTSSLLIIDLATDRPATVPSVDVGSLPDGVAASLDSRRAYVASGLNRTLVAVDLTTNQRIAQLGIPGTPGGVAVGPNGLIYVTASNTLYEIDWRDGLVVTVPGGFAFTGEPNRPVFTPNGRYLLFATRPNNAASTVGQFEVATRTITTVTGPANLDNIVVANNSQAYGLAGGVVYSIGIAPLQPPGLSPIGALSGTMALAVSDETPSARFLFGQTANTLYRVDLVNSQFGGPSPTVGTAIAALFRATPSTGAVAGLQNTMSAAPVAPGARTFPIAVRAVDASGRPVANATIQYTTSGQGLQLPVTTAQTNNDGLASVSAIAPGAAGSFMVRATSTGGLVDIPIEVTARPIVERRFSIFRGQGQVVTAGSTAVPFQVRLRDELGNPIAGEIVNWAVESGLGISVVTPATSTDSAGVATGLFSTEAFTPTMTQQFRTFTVQAAVSTGTLEAAVSIFGVMIPSGSGVNVQLTTTLQQTAGVFQLPAGGVINSAFQAQVFTQPSTGSGLLPVPVPNVGIRASMVESTRLEVRCVDDPVTSAAGSVTCDLAIGSELGTGIMAITVGELPSQTFQYDVDVIPGAPATLSIIQGNGQAGGPGVVTPLALVAEVRDSAGNPLRNVEIGWTILSGSGELVNPRFTTDGNGRASTQVRFGPLPGTVTVRASTGALTTNFTLTNTAAGGVVVTIQSGSGQSAQINQPFPAPLVVRVTSGDGQPLSGTVVSFTGSGPVTLGAPSATTNAQGIASITATAGGMAGGATVTANAAGTAAVFNLTVTLAGPRIDSLLNGASFQPGVSPCSVGVIRGSFGIPANTVLTPSVGPIPLLAFTLNGISVQVGGQTAPIYYTSNIDGQQQVGVQIPCELPPGMTELRVTAGGASSTLPIGVADVAPGIFEMETSPGVLQGIVLRPNGTYVTQSNPARHNEVVTGYYTGLGSAIDAQGTNIPGIGQALPLDRLIVGVNNQGMPVVSASYAPNLIGAWVVSFRITEVAGEGGRQAYAIAVRNFEGNVIFGQPSSIAIRAR
jgi:uncharacterized protein (TIGR03437 family)